MGRAARFRLAVLTTLVVGLAAAVPNAFADDAALADAYRNVRPTLSKSLADYTAARKKASRTSGARWRRALRRLIAADREMNRALSAGGASVKAEAASTDNGTTARTDALNEIFGWRKANVLEIRAIRAELAGHRREAGRLSKRANATMYRVFRFGKAAVAALEAAGFPDIKPASAA